MNKKPFNHQNWLHLPYYRSDAIRMLFAIGRPQCQAALEVVLDRINKGESLEASLWTDSRWYVTITDLALKAILPAQERIRAARFALTLDVRTDVLLWNHLGGNCWVRGRRWRNICKAAFPAEWADNEVVPVRDNRVGNKHIHLYKG